MKYSIKHLRYCVALATHKSFSNAALECNVTQSTLSLGIQELERQMDVMLFERSRGNVIPTAAGETVLGYARKILSLGESLHSDIRAQNNPNAGPLRIGAIPTIAPYFLPQCLPNLEKKFPDSDLRIAEDTTEVILEKIKNGDMDLGILALPVNTGDLETRTLFEENFILAAPKAFKLPRSINRESLGDQNLLLLREGHCLKDHILSACKLPPEKQNRFFEAESLHTLLAMVNQGYGVTLLPQMATKSNIEKAYPNVITRKFITPAPSRQIGLIWRKTDVRRSEYLKLDF